ncbi:deoxyribose-phosphate aldolase [Candidatus Pacearchaeota archaeon]|nr:deoxyribose-phosphate aldolase [Candidatus Pacearchaeota archaeon]
MIYTPSRQKIAKRIDHTNLKADATSADITKLCQEAVDYGFYSVCIQPSYVKQAVEQLKGTDVKVCTVVGFPTGASKWNVKKYEALSAYQDGASEVDMVMNIGAFKDRRYEDVRREIRFVMNERNAVPHGNILVKVIIETCYLTPNEIRDACLVVSDAGADFIKTSTGFGPAGAKVEDVKLMYETIQELKSGLKIKAAGGISTLDDALAMINAGASRLGCSKSKDIVNSI